MKNAKIFAGLGALVGLVTGCYTLASTLTVSSTSRAWTGTGHGSVGGPRHAFGLAGQDIYAFESGRLAYTWTGQLLEQFGGPYVLTSLAQTHNEGHYEHNFIHGNRQGRTDNLDLLHTFRFSFFSARWIREWDASIWDGGQYFDVVQVCELAAASVTRAGKPSDPDSHLFMSVRACPRSGGACAGGVLEAFVNVDPGVERWWVKSNQDGVQATLRKPDGTRFSDECMPIAVTSDGDQRVQYLVVGDPSWDELSVFNSSRLWAGPVDNFRREESGLNIADLAIEGRGEGTVDYAFLAVLWSGSTSKVLRHYTLANGGTDGTPHLTESLPADVAFIETPGAGAEGTSGDLFTFGNRVIRRRYD